MLDIKTGDIVRYKGNGKQMTVIEVMENGTIHCSYMDMNDKVQQGFFELNTLEKVTKNGIKNRIFKLVILVSLILIGLLLYHFLK
jgi:uncharacterized protein YodC (DUF2158 family)